MKTKHVSDEASSIVSCVMRNKKKLQDDNYNNSN